MHALVTRRIAQHSAIVQSCSHFDNSCDFTAVRDKCFSWRVDARASARCVAAGLIVEVRCHRVSASRVFASVVTRLGGVRRAEVLAGAAVLGARCAAGRPESGVAQEGESA